MSFVKTVSACVVLSMTFSAIASLENSGGEGDKKQFGAHSFTKSTLWKKKCNLAINNPGVRSPEALAIYEALGKYIVAELCDIIAEYTSSPKPSEFAWGAYSVQAIAFMMHYTQPVGIFGLNDGRIKLCSMSSNDEPYAELQGHAGAIGNVFYSDKHKVIISGARKNGSDIDASVIKLWKVDHDNLKKTCCYKTIEYERGGGCWNMAMLPDESGFAIRESTICNYRNQVIQIRLLPNGELLRKIDLGSDNDGPVSFNYDGTLLILNNVGASREFFFTTYAWQEGRERFVSEKNVNRHKPKAGLFSFKPSPSQNQAAFCSSDGTASLLDLITGQITSHMPRDMQTKRCWGTAWSPSGNLLASIGTSKSDQIGPVVNIYDVGKVTSIAQFITKNGQDRIKFFSENMLVAFGHVYGEVEVFSDLG